MSEVLEYLPMLVPLLALMIPIVVVFTKHQQKMAEILHRSAGDQDEIRALRQEIAELKSLVLQQAISRDDRQTQTVADRLTVG